MSARPPAPVFASKFATWWSTVRVDRKSRAAIWAFVMPWATSVSTSISRLVTPNARSPGGTAGRWRPAAAMPRESAASEQVGDHVGVGTRVSGQARPHRSDVRRLGAVRGRHGGVAEMLDGADRGRRDGEQHLVVTVTGRLRQRHERVQVAEAGGAGEQDSHDTLRESRGRRPFDGSPPSLGQHRNRRARR